MNRNYNGFATEEQYKAVRDIIFKEIDGIELNTIMITMVKQMNGVDRIEVDVETDLGHQLTYYMDARSGVFYVRTDGENFPSTECRVMAALNGVTKEIFNEVA